MAAAGMGVGGVSRLRETLNAAARELTSLGGAHVEAGQLLAEHGGRTAPRRSGRLSESVGFTVEDAGFTVTAAAPYAAYVNARDPWLTRSYDANETAIIDIYTDAVADTVDHIKGQ